MLKSKSRSAMKIDLKVTFTDGESVTSTGWPDQPILSLFKHIAETMDDVALVEVVNVRHGVPI